MAFQMPRFTGSLCITRSCTSIVRGKHPYAITPIRLCQSFQAMSQPSSSRQLSGMTSIFSKDGVPPIGPYSHAMKANGLIWVSGQIPANTKSELVEGTITEQTHKMCQNARAVVEAAGSRLDKVVKVNVYLENLDDFKEMNEVYAQYFPHKPARSCIEAKRLPLNASMEMDLVALE